MFNKIKFNIRIIILPIIISVTLIGIIKVHADWSPPSSPKIDDYRNNPNLIKPGFPITGGSSVEYNGVRIGNTIWCKPSDVLGVTAWGKQKKVDNDIINSIKTSYLSLDGTNSPTKFSKDQPLDSDGHSGEFNTISGSSDATVVSARRGRTADSNNYQHYGALFWIKFNEPDKTYGIRSNQLSYNGSWLAEENDLSKWPISNETIKTDGTAPDITVSPNTSETQGKDIPINIDINDSGCGLQYYTYVLKKDGQVIDSKNLAPQNHSDITSKSVFVTEDDKSLYDNNDASGGYVNNYDPEAKALTSITNDMQNQINLNGAGNYTLEITAIDNLGNTSTAAGTYIIKHKETPPPEIPITIAAAVTPNPSKQGQQVTFDINTTGNAKYLSIYIPVEITSVDTYGTVFPITKTIKEEQTHNEKVQYVIPLKAPQSILRNGIRTSLPYKVIITAKRQDGKSAETSVNLDISGNILDGIKTEIIGSGYDKKH